MQGADDIDDRPFGCRVAQLHRFKRWARRAPHEDQ
jgi:hypothetical protein